MRTIVHQSYRTANVPEALGRCLASVRSWAAAKGFDYRFMDDAFFGVLPDGFREKVSGRVLPMSDLARLIWARDLLAEGYDRVIWLDADVLVFDPTEFDVPTTDQYGVGRELWVRRGGRDKLLFSESLHNAVLVFCRGNDFLDFYIHACRAIAETAAAPIVDHALGPDFLVRLRDVIGRRVLSGVGMFSPILTADIARGGGRVTRAFVAEHRAPIQAANLCWSFLGRPQDNYQLTEPVINRAIDQLLQSQGAMLSEMQTGRPRN